MKYILVTQTFAPRTGGMQTVMIALSKSLGSLAETHVFPDHFISNQNKSWNEKIFIHNNFSPKIFRSFIKKKLVSKVFKDGDIIICDSWKSVKAVPHNADKVIVLAHGQEYLSVTKKISLIKKSLDRATHIICSSKYTHELIKNLNITDTKKSVIPPTYSLKKVIINKQNSSKSLNTLNFLSITRLEERKGISLVLDALGSLVKSNSIKHSFVWNICGIGNQKKQIEEKIKLLNLSNQVKLIGKINNQDKDYFLNSSDLFIMPSYSVGKSIEGFGISYIEAAAYGIPSIAGVEGGVKDAVLDKKTGWCVDPLNKDELLNVLLEAINNNKKREKFGSQAKKQFIDEFLGEKVFRKFMRTIST